MGQDFSLLVGTLFLALLVTALLVMVEAWLVLRLVKRWFQMGLGLPRRKLF